MPFNHLSLQMISLFVEPQFTTFTLTSLTNKPKIEAIHIERVKNSIKDAFLLPAKIFTCFFPSTS